MPASVEQNDCLVPREPLSGTVLYVEDDENDVVFMRVGFRKAGLPYALEITTDGREAMDYLAGNGRYADRAAHPLPCLVLLDLNAPGLCGFDFLQWVRQQPPFHDLPVVLFTGTSRETDKDRARQLGANELVIKPGDVSQLPKLLEGIVERWLVKPER